MRSLFYIIKLVLCSVFAVFFVLDDAQVAGVAGFTDVMVCDGFQNGAVGFVGVGAIAEAAFFGGGKDFGKIMTNFFDFHVNGAKAFDSRGVNEVTAIFELKHF